MFNNCGTWRKSLDISDSEVAGIFNKAFKKSCIPEELTIERTARQIRCTFDDGSEVWDITIAKEDETTRPAYAGTIHNDRVVPADMLKASTADVVEFALAGDFPKDPCQTGGYITCAHKNPYPPKYPTCAGIVASPSALLRTQNTASCSSRLRGVTPSLPAYALVAAMNASSHALTTGSGSWRLIHVMRRLWYNSVKTCQKLKVVYPKKPSITGGFLCYNWNRNASQCENI